MTNREVHDRWGSIVRLRALSVMGGEHAISLEIVGPRGGSRGYVSLSEADARELMSALALSLAEVDIDKYKAAAA